MDALRIGLQVLLVLTSALLVLTILMHKGKGGGMSDMFGGGLSSSVSSSGVAERNLNRITIGTAVLWGVVVLLLGLIQKFVVV
ncbi:preprotein translocase subunit SecG [Litorihabitans aurantiacus]|uniref:Protein-export membrane protein SecG n=1 Tax=Litorihabitans aurantiacus TaxID=1930061 RepID=A0AA37UNS6_9MICO|nr:preprotein translocase subunit SecG [Litorihabitans aurantiacus]GMA31174.1 preprotein translocase subunit SecG [Litorihabitans aurantiacus]